VEGRGRKPLESWNKNIFILGKNTSRVEELFCRLAGVYNIDAFCDLKRARSLLPLICLIKTPSLLYINP
jgi:hypothetical protein